MTLHSGSPAAQPARQPGTQPGTQPATGGGCDPEPVLAAYPHVSRCPACRSYTAELLAEYPPLTVLPATLAHHDSGHTYDPTLAATEHFAAQE